MKNLYKIEDELCIISDTENVNENCWIITDGRLVQVSYLLSDEVAKGNKVILTTNKLLIKDGVQSIGDEFLEWFIKNPSCENVEIKKSFDYKDKTSNGGYGYGFYKKYKIIFPIEEFRERDKYIYNGEEYRVHEIKYPDKIRSLKDGKEFYHLIKDCKKIISQEDHKQETVQQFIEQHGITKQQLIDGYKQGLELIFENASKITEQETLEEAAERLWLDSTSQLTSKKSFIKGANWQKEQEKQALQTAINLLKQTTEYDVLDSWKEKVKELEKLL
jgi:hypothetical protein